MAISKVTYLGDLRTTSSHLKSGKIIITDAPIDNNGKGDAFSPTDTVATALASCMITIMGIKARDNDWNIEKTQAEVTKIMGSNPRRISAIHVNLKIPGVSQNEKAQQLLQRVALNCPVAKSLSEIIEQEINFEFI